VKLPAITQAPLDRHPTNIISQWRDEWKSALVVNSSLVDDSTIWQPGFDLPRCYWALQNRFWTSHSHCASCRMKWGLAATDMCPCGKHQMMSHIVNSCPQSKLEGRRGAAAIALSWRCWYWKADVVSKCLGLVSVWWKRGKVLVSIWSWIENHMSVSYHRVLLTSQYAQLFASLQNCMYIVLNARQILFNWFTILLIYCNASAWDCVWPVLFYINSFNLNVAIAVAVVLAQCWQLKVS